MQYNNLCVFDFETSSRDKSTTQILQIGAVILNRNNLKIMDEFKLLVKPDDFTIIEEEALAVNRLSIAELEKAIDTSTAWKQFTTWVNKYNKSKHAFNAFDAPIPCGYNINGFDLPIVARYCEKYGPYDIKRKSQKLFHPIHKIDIMDHMFFWMENNADLNKLDLVSLMEYMGFDKEKVAGAHDALVDVKNTTEILVKLLTMQRYLTGKNESGGRRLEMKGCFAKEKAHE